MCPQQPLRSSACTACRHWGDGVAAVAQREGVTCSGHTASPPASLPGRVHLGWVLRVSWRRCCSHLPGAALQKPISTPGLPLVALPWRPLWIFPRQTFLHGLSAQAQSPRVWGAPEPSLDPWAAVAWEQEAGSERASHCPERRARSAPGDAGS